ncbi:MAG: DNA polymerase III subunit chi [Gammaproteobacteria bacterium]|nr:DNA polymerase III subunit chi [Gammaproteobacteria bacterium]MDE2348379.1 DNA polymerase III subunit chi [Gammaproteobacteria bacterium]
MTERVDFYVIGGAAPKLRDTVACRLAEKAYVGDLRVVILAGSPADADRLDELLWTFSEGSFVPHAICGAGAVADPDVRVHLTADAERVPDGDILVNLSDRMPPQPARFARIAEIIDADPQRRSLGRARFKSYRDLRIPLQTHQLDAAGEIPAP